MGVAKWKLRKYVKLIVPLIDFLKEEYRPFTAIGREAVRRDIIKEAEVDSYYHFFTTAEDSLHLFKSTPIPYDQSPTGRSRIEWKLSEDMTESKVMDRINEYVQNNFRTSLYEKLPRNEQGDSSLDDFS